MARLDAARMSSGSEFHAAGPRSPNLVRSRGVTYLLLEADRRPVRVAAMLDVRMMSLRYAGHLPVLNDHAQFEVNTTADWQQVQHHLAWRDVVANVQLMNQACCSVNWARWLEC